MPTSLPNADQSALWNESSGLRWLALQERTDAQLDPLGLLAMERLPIVQGARVLDIGCGCGATSLELARRVGPMGHVTGVDISEPMLARAQERAAAEHLSQTTFVRADAQQHPFEPRSFDALFSRFGVMFFDDPIAAFTNLRKALRPNGTLSFVCWRARQENAWVTAPMEAIRPYVSPPPPADPHAPGPFAFADATRLADILTRAGFSDLAIDPRNTPMQFGGPGDVASAAEFATQIGPAAVLLREQHPTPSEEILSSLRVALTPYATADAVVMNAAIWIVTAAAR